MSKTRQPGVRLITVIGQPLINDLDRIAEQQQFDNRSELIREILRRHVMEWKKEQGELYHGPASVPSATCYTPGIHPGDIEPDGTAGDADVIRRAKNLLDKGKRR